MDKRYTINTRMGPMTVEPGKTIRFSRGLIGFEYLREFALFDYKPGTPFHFLQSLENLGLGMLLADPFAFLPKYEIRLSAMEERILKVRSIRDLIVLVSVSVPKGNPEETTLNLTGPICVNAVERLGLQAPQVDLPFPGRILLRELGTKEQQSVSA